MATAADRRSVAVSLKQLVGTLKTAVDAVNTAVTAFTLDGADGALPTALEVKAQLAAYDAITKGTVSLTDSLAQIRAAV
jgi:hypothetical protein